MSPGDYMLYRCDDCQIISVVSHLGGDLPDCECDDPTLRRISRLRVEPAGEWSELANPIRDTVDGPPALLWLQHTDGYGLYVGGKQVLTIAGHDLPTAGLRLLNGILATAAPPQ